MAGPWDKYQQPAASGGEGPWTKYQAPQEGGATEKAIEMVKHPVRSFADLLRSTSNFVTFGGRDLIAPYLGSGRTHEQEMAETQAASSRLGTFDEAANLGLAMLQPSATASYLPEGAGMLRSALGYGAEGALQSGTRAAVQGEDVPSAMATGAAFGAGGSAAGQGLGSIGARVANPQAGTPNLLRTIGSKVEPLALGGGKSVQHLPAIAVTEAALAHFGIPPGVTTAGATTLNLLGKTPLGQQSATMANPAVVGSTRDALARMMIGMGRQ